MKTVSFQGATLSPGQKRQLEFQRAASQAFLNNTLTQQVNETMAAIEARKEQGIRPEKVWEVLYQSRKGTLCIAEWMGY